MIFRKRLRGRGFTLIELMIVMAIISILATPIVHLEVSSREGLYSNIRRQEMAEAGNRVLEWIARDFRSCRAMEKRWQNETLSSNRLILSFPDGSVVIYRFDKEKKAISRIKYPSQNVTGEPLPLTLANYVDRFMIHPVDVGTGLIQIELDLSREMIHSRERVTVHGIAARRIR